jgi:hypothetical protein
MKNVIDIKHRELFTSEVKQTGIEGSSPNNG